MPLERLFEQVRFNCQVASAYQAGTYSLCGLLLRLRQLYKWQHGLRPWEEPEPAPVLDWVAAQEAAWEALAEEPWHPLGWGEGEDLEPFAVEAINQRLWPLGLAYGAGYTRGLVPTFFLGELNEVRREGDLTILVLGPERARDLDATPALRQGPLIYARREALAYYLWDRLADPTQQNNAFLKIALAAYGLPLEELLRDPGVHEPCFAQFLAAELEAAVAHERGEALEPGLKTVFPTLVESGGRVELWARALKDALAEVHESGRLAFLIQTRGLASLALLLAWRPGLYPFLLPELEPAFWELWAHGDWEVMEQARKNARRRLRRVAAELEELVLSPRGSRRLRPEIESRYLAPLGL